MNKRVDYTITIKGSYKTARGHSRLPKRLIKDVLNYARIRLAYQSPCSAICQGITAEVSEYHEAKIGPKEFWTDEVDGKIQTLK